MKLHAYTLMEVMLTLVISSMVIVFTYTIFLYLDKQLITYQTETIAYQNLKITEKTLRRDIYLCNTLNVTEDQIDMIHYDETIISYKKEGNTLYRKSNNGVFVSLDIPIIKWSITDNIYGVKHGTLIQLTTKVHKDTINLVFTKQKTEMAIKNNK